jgi:hypothetical protein
MADYVYYIGEGIGGLVHIIVCVRLLALGVRDAQTTDRLLSVAFLFWALSYLLYGAPWLYLRNEELIPPLFLFGSALTLHLGTITIAVFTWAAFRSRERWAVWLLAGMVGCLIVGAAGSVWLGDWGGEYPLSHPWWWVARVGGAAPYAWMGTEGLVQYVKARRRRQLGLCPPQVCNRYLLWSLAGALWLIVEVVEGAEFIVYQSTGQWSDLLTVFVGLFEAVPAGIIWLIFFPPAFYKRWVERAAPAATAVEG